MRFVARTDRINYIDGLRGVAVGMVVLHHCVAAFAMPMGTGIGPLGVSLFFVLSGFCLAYPVLRDRKFDLRVFWSRRARRILPPYYIALALYAPLAAHWDTWHLKPIWPFGSVPISLPDVLTHVLLIHNFVPDFSLSIDAPFWSLGVEWQWYVVFPLLLAAFVRWPRASLTLTLIVAIVWAGIGQTLGGWRDYMLLPGRLFEFCCGIGCAWAVVRGRVGSPWLSSAVAALAIGALTLWPVELSRGTPIYFAIAGTGFGALILAAHASPVLARLLSSRPLLWLGGISYSVYLIHAPAAATVEAGLYPLSQFWAQVLGVAVSIGLGWCFCQLVERPAIAWSRRSRSSQSPLKPREDSSAGRAVEKRSKPCSRYRGRRRVWVSILPDVASSHHSVALPNE